MTRQRQTSPWGIVEEKVTFWHSTHRHLSVPDTHGEE